MSLLFVARTASGGLLDEPPELLRFRLDEAMPLTLFEPHRPAALERLPDERRYLEGPWGRPRWRSIRLAWSTATCEPGDALGLAGEPFAEDGGEERLDAPASVELLPELSLLGLVAPAWRDRFEVAWLPGEIASTGPGFHSDGFNRLWSLPRRRGHGASAAADCFRRPVTLMRHGNERETFSLLRCDGTLAPGALDRLSILARPPGAPRPEHGVLPDHPDDASWRAGEWIPRVRLVHPRLAWVLQRIAEAFPRRAVYLYSGYRADPGDAAEDGELRRGRRGSHLGQHRSARALDLKVIGVDNADLFRFCRTLPDVGCGYYPNSKFVHVDLRPPATGRGKVFWIDVSAPGMPSLYVDGWPGVAEPGTGAWVPRSPPAFTSPARERSDP